MARVGSMCLLAVVVALTAQAAIAAPAALVTPSQLTKSFRQTTGDRLVLNRSYSSPGHYQAYDVGVPSIAKKGKYGTFTVYVVTGPDVEAEVKGLLIDLHTGQLGIPGPGQIYWESGTTIHGDRFWMAKRRYGDNVVLEWTGETPIRKTDRTFKLLHTALTKATR